MVAPDDTRAGTDAVLDAEIAAEQCSLDHMYELLDKKYEQYRQAQRRAMATTGAGTPQSLVERDVLAAHFGESAAALEQIEDRLVFGRLDNCDGETAYVGRVGLSDGNKQALIDWRAQAARPFYQATAANPLGVIRRRHIGVRMRKISTLDDDVFDAEAASRLGGVIHGEGALLTALSRARTGHMSDIVSTIQAEQDKVIRHPAKQILVIQGGPGTGKTVVALHRAAYMLYTHRERLARSGVLIVGPSRTFLRYIEQVLPALGETGVVSATIGTLLPGIKAEPERDDRVAALKGSLKWVEAARILVRSLVRDPGCDQQFRIGAKTLVLSRQFILDTQREVLSLNETHHSGRDIFATAMVQHLTRQLMADDTSGDWGFASDQIRSNVDIRRAVNLAWLPYPATRLVAKLWAKPELLRRCAPFLSNAERKLLYRPIDAPFTSADVPLIDEVDELLGDLPARNGQSESNYDDINRAREAIEAISAEEGLVNAEVIASRAAAEQSRMTTAESARISRSWTYGHIVVDEAQEITPMGWRSLMRRCPSRSMTVVGDLAQRSTLPAAAAWRDALGPAERGLEDVATLEVCYRTPAEIMTEAERRSRAAGLQGIIPLTAVRSLPESVRITNAGARILGASTPQDIDKRTINAWTTTIAAAIRSEHERLPGGLTSTEGRVAVIVPARHSIYRNIAETAAATVDTTTSRFRTQVIEPDDAKGLEFDATIVIDPELIGTINPAALYVSLTRSTQSLHMVEPDSGSITTS